MYDSNAKVRRLVVEKIACIKPVIPHIISRTRDVDAGVRMAAYTKLSKMVQALKVSILHPSNFYYQKCKELCTIYVSKIVTNLHPCNLEY